MSGFIGIVNSNGAPVDRQLLRSMTDYLSFRGPDGTNLWVQHNVGFGHSMLRTTFEAADEEQPFTLDGRHWIIADARLDGREELLSKLAAKNHRVATKAPDTVLILQAYSVWGDRCTHHLLGDFSFGIWDCELRRLFCARDHFGIKPFFYACVKDSLVFSNTLDCLRLHPLVSTKLNEVAVANFLFFRYQPKIDMTTFADISRLLPAHSLLFGRDLHRICRYWSVPVKEPVKYRTFGDYVERFKELFDTAVDDRLRTDRVAVEMSGGMDSTSIAATAHKGLVRQSINFDLRAYTIVYENCEKDEEGFWARLVAEQLNIPIDTVAVDDFELFQGWDRPQFYLPEPANYARSAIDIELRRRMLASGNRIAFAGQGGDPLFLSSPVLNLPLIESLGCKFSLQTVVTHMRLLRQLPPLGIRTTLKRWLGHDPQVRIPDRRFEAKLNPIYLQRLNLPLPWCQLEHSPPRHPFRPKAYDDLIDPIWPIIFEKYDGTWTRCPIEYRFPYFDRRLVEFVLTVPPAFCTNKLLLRAAMRDRLQDGVRLRPKAPLMVPLTRKCIPWIVGEARPCERFKDFLAVHQLHDLIGRDGRIEEDNIRLVVLNYWLKHVVADQRMS